MGLWRGRPERCYVLIAIREGSLLSAMGVSKRCGAQVEKVDSDPCFCLSSLPQSGDYLFVISPAGEPGECMTTFEIGN